MITPPAGRVVRRWRYDDAEPPLHLVRGEEMGRFNMGSTVIVLFGPQALDWAEDIQPEAAIRMGQRLGTRRLSGTTEPQ